MATSTIEPVPHQLAQGRLQSELANGDLLSALRPSRIVHLDAAGSTKSPVIVVPDEAIRIHGVGGRPIRVMDLNSQAQPIELALYIGRAHSDWSHTSGFDLFPHESPPLGDYRASSTATLTEWPLELPVTFSHDDDMETVIHLVVEEFANGVNGVAPPYHVVAAAERVVQAALNHTVGPEITVDDEDGIDFHLRLLDGSLVMANLFPDGTIDASVYDDSQGTPVKTVKRMRRATTSEADLLHLFRTGTHASTAR